MRAILLGAILATFVIFSRTHDEWCNVCPGGPTTDDKNSTCSCEKDFYDPSTGTCVGYFNCPLFKPLFSTTVKSIVSVGVKTMTSSIVTRTVELLAQGTLDLLLPNITKSMEDLARTILASSHDIDIINSIIKKRLVQESGNITSGFSVLSNPYLIRNKKLLDACENNTMCVVQKLMEKNAKKSQTSIATIVRNILDQIILSLKDIRDYGATNCKEEEEEECPLIKTIVKYKDLLSEFLVTLQQSTDYLGKLAANALITMKPVENETFNKILTNIGVYNL